MSSLVLDKVFKYYSEEICVLNDISLEIDSGEFLVLLGPSGCGKSTLLHAIAGLHGISSGEIKLGSRTINDVPCQDRDIAMVFQSYALYPSMTVAQNIAFPLEMRKVPRQERDEAVDRVAALLQIKHLLNRKPGQLSGGQRQRVAIGRALVREPALFLFDEPLSNLDALLRVEMRTELKKLHARMGRTTVYVTHDQTEAMTLATRVAILDKGVIQQFDTPANVYHQPANLFVATFIGNPSINLFPAVTRGGHVALDNTDLHLTVPSAFAPYLGPDGRPLTVGVRPEYLDLVKADSAPARDHEVDFEAQVTLIEPTGSDDVVLFQLGGKEYSALVRSGQVSTLGPVRWRLDTSRISLFDSQTGQRLPNTQPLVNGGHDYV